MEKVVTENRSQERNVEVTKDNKMLFSLDLGHLAFKGYFWRFGFFIFID